MEGDRVNIEELDPVELEAREGIVDLAIETADLDEEVDRVEGLRAKIHTQVIESCYDEVEAAVAGVQAHPVGSDEERRAKEGLRATFLNRMRDMAPKP